MFLCLEFKGCDKSTWCIFLHILHCICWPINHQVPIKIDVTINLVLFVQSIKKLRLSPLRLFVCHSCTHRVLDPRAGKQLLKFTSNRSFLWYFSITNHTIDWKQIRVGQGKSPYVYVQTNKHSSEIASLFIGFKNNLSTLKLLPQRQENCRQTA